jgi:hypothetical protein
LASTFPTSSKWHTCQTINIFNRIAKERENKGENQYSPSAQSRLTNCSPIPPSSAEDPSHSELLRTSSAR